MLRGSHRFGLQARAVEHVRDRRLALELGPRNGQTHVHLAKTSPPMMRPMMQAMTSLNTADEMTETINRIKKLSEQQSPSHR